MMRSGNSVISAALGMGALLVGVAHGAPLPPEGLPLIPGMVFSVYDLTFTIDDVVTTATGTALIGSLMVVPDSWYMIGFDIRGFASATGAGSMADVFIRYRVNSESPFFPIAVSALEIAATPSDGVRVDEILTRAGDPLADLHATGMAPWDFTSFYPTKTEISVVEDIFAQGFGEDGSVQWSEVGQTFGSVSCCAPPPEPLTLALFGGGLACLGLVLRRRPS